MGIRGGRSRLRGRGWWRSWCWSGRRGRGRGSVGCGRLRGTRRFQRECPGSGLALISVDELTSQSIKGLVRILLGRANRIELSSIHTRLVFFFWCKNVYRNWLPHMPVSLACPTFLSSCQLCTHLAVDRFLTSPINLTSQYSSDINGIVRSMVQSPQYLCLPQRCTQPTFTPS